jgi:hypothetical protein
MTWFLWGATFGWAVGMLFFYSLREQDHEKANNAAWVVLLTLFVAAFFISISLGVQSGAIVRDMPAPTPTYEGR